MEAVGPRRLLFGPSYAPDMIRRELRVMSAHCGITPAVTPQTLRTTGINMWADAVEEAGKIMQGTGIPRVWMHYRNQLRRLNQAMPKVELPPSMLAFGSDQDRQLRLF